MSFFIKLHRIALGDIECSLHVHFVNPRFISYYMGTDTGVVIGIGAKPDVFTYRETAAQLADMLAEWESRFGDQR